LAMASDTESDPTPPMPRVRLSTPRADPTPLVFPSEARPITDRFPPVDQPLHCGPVYRLLLSLAAAAVPSPGARRSWNTLRLPAVHRPQFRSDTAGSAVTFRRGKMISCNRALQ